MEAADEDSACSISLLHFICDEQLQLLQVPKHVRQYSTNLITLSFLWQLTITASCKKLRDALILPSISRLGQYSSGMSVETSCLDLSYLTAKKDSLEEWQTSKNCYDFYDPVSIFILLLVFIMVKVLAS